MESQVAPRDGFVTSQDNLRLHYREFGGPDRGRIPLVCIPGLTRNARDFERLAADLGRERRVVAIDLRGRGQSDRDPDYAHYTPRTYVADVLDVMAALGLHEAIFLGTSLGGIVTILLSVQRPTAIRAAILNDIGPDLKAEGANRIRATVGLKTRFPSWQEAAAYFREQSADLFPDFEDREWEDMARRIGREEGGAIVLDYDPKIGDAVRDGYGRLADLWPAFGALARRPVLVLRGETSDILSEETVARMAERAPDLTAATIPGRGHAPTLDEPASRRAIEAFLARLDEAG